MRESGLLYESERTRVWREPHASGALVLKAPNYQPVLHADVAHYERAAGVAARAEGLTPSTVLELRSGTPHLISLGGAEQTLADQYEEIDAIADRLALLCDVVDTIGRFHDLGLVHGDIRASNCLVDPSSGRVLLIDLESSRSFDGVDLPGAARLSDPQIAADPRTDLHAFGSLLEEWVTTAADADGLRTGSLGDVIDRLTSGTLAAGYQSAGVVASDLRRCLNSLRVTGTIAPFEVGLERVSPVLDLEGVLVGRDAEINRLNEMFDASAIEPGHVALIDGHPGAGKSALAARYAQSVQERGGVVGRGKFEAGATDPYGPITQALGDIVRSMLGATSHEFDRWREELLAAVAPSAHVLLPLAPDLRVVFVDATPGSDLGALEARNRLHRALAELLKATAAVKPVALVIDDLQWADSDSLRALTEVLDLAGRNFMFVGTHRDGEFDPATLGVASGDYESISIAGLGHVAVEQFIEATVGASPSLDQAAVIIAERSAGNPLFIKEIIRRAQQEGALRFESTTARWLWDLPRLADLALSDSVVDLLLLSFDQMTPEHARILSDVACIGGPFTLRTAAESSGVSGSDAAEALWDALGLRLIEPVSGEQRRIRVVDADTTYRFTHDRVAEAAIARIDGPARQRAHLRYGRYLRIEDEGPTFEIAHHLNEALMLIDDEAERAELVQLNLGAASEAIERASFPLARSFFEAGIELLGPGGWDSDPDTAADLHRGAAETSLLVGDIARAHEWLDTAMPNMLERTSVRAAQLAVLRMRALVAEQRLNEALDTAIDALGRLGYDIRRQPNQLHAGGALLSSRRLLRSVSDEDLLQREPCRDPEILQVQQVMAEAIEVAYIIQPELFPLLVRRSLELTLRNGLMPLSAVSFVHYGVLLAAGLSDYKGARRWGELGLKLAATEQCAASRNATAWLYYNFIHHWTAPLEEARTPLLESYRKAVESGALEAAGWTAAVSTYFSFAQGLPLAEVDTLAGRLTPPIRSQRVQTRLCQSTQQLVLNLMGRSESPFLLAGESGFDERDARAAAEQEGDSVSLGATALTKLALHFWYGDAAGALDLIPEVEEHLEGMAGTLNVPSFHLMDAYCRAVADPNGRATKKAIGRARRKFKKWAASCPSTYGPMAAIVEGAWQLSRDNTVQAEIEFDRAIAAADEARLSQYAALARESLADLYEASERNTLARTIRRDAYEQWRSLGMTARSDRMEREYPWLISGDASMMQSSADVQGLLDATHAISGETQLDDLLTQLVDQACDLTAATGGLAYLVADTGLQCRIVRRSGRTAVVDGVGSEGPVTLIRYVERARRPLRLDDVRASSLGIDPHADAHGTKSTLTIPIASRGHVVAVLHVEHDQHTGAFTPEHQQTLLMLAAQMGVSLENVELVSRLEAALDSQEMLTAAQSRFIPNEILRIFDSEDIRTVRVGDTVERNMAVLISDIRGYTRLVEELSLSEAGRIAIDFLQLVEPAIIGNNGFVQDMRGDEVLALFGGDGDDAVRAALAIRRAQLVQNERRVEVGLPPVDAGIGVTAGDVMMTMVGGLNRMTCGVIGDAVNLASRIEGLNKRYGTSLLIGQALVDSLVRPEAFSIRRLERVKVVNRSEAVVVYEVYDNDPPELAAKKRAAQPQFDAAFARLDAGDTVGALVAFEACVGLIPDDVVAQLHIDQCRLAIDDRLVDLRFAELSEK